MMIDTHAMRVALELGASEASARKAPLPMGEGLG
jgi:hypothetical protein